MAIALLAPRSPAVNPAARREFEIELLLAEFDRVVDVPASWPGNVGELVSRIRRSVTVAESRNRVERESVERALSQCANNVSRAARQLGIGRVTLNRLLKKHGIDPPGQC